MTAKLIRWLSPPGIWRRLLRVVRMVALVCLVLLAAVLYLVGTSSGRHNLLKIAMPLIQDKLPGHLTWAQIRWPSLGRFELEGILWRDDMGDTLLALNEADLAISVRDLRHRDVYAPHILANGLQADLMALQTLFAAAPGQDPGPALEDTVPSNSSFPRPGAVAGIPSVGIGDLQLNKVSLRLNATQRIQMDHMQASLDLLADSFDQAEVTDSTRTWDGEPVPASVEANHLGKLDLQGILWRTVSGDTLLALTEAGMVADLAELMRRDLFLPRLWATGLTANVPALQSYLTAAAADSGFGDTTSVPAGSAPDGPLLLRPGALAGLPSVGIGDLLLASSSVHLTEDQRIELVDLKASADLRADRSAKVTAAWRLWPTPQLAFSARLEAALDDSLRVRLTPLHLTVPPTHMVPDPTTFPLSGGIVVALSELLSGDKLPAAKISDLSLTGDFGDVWLDGQLARGGGGTVHLRARRPQNRAHLLKILGHLAGEQSQTLALADSLWSFWPSREDSDIDLRITLAPATTSDPFKPGHVDLSGHFILPGPRDLKPLLPNALQVDDLDFVRGWLDGSVDLTAAEPSYRGRIDLSETPWLTRALLVAAGSGGNVRVDSLELVLPGCEFQASGSVVGEDVDLTAHLHVPDPSLLGRWQNEALTDLDVQLTLDLRAAGTLPHPDLELNFTSGGRYGTTQVPAMEGSVQSRAGYWEVDVTLPEGLAFDSVQLKTAQISYQGSLPDTSRNFGGSFRVAARDAERTFVTAGRVDLGESYFLQVDSLTSTWRDQSFTAQRPFKVSFDPNISRVHLTDLDLVGDPGRVWGVCTVQPDSLDVQLKIDLNLVLASVQNWLPDLPFSLAPDDTLVVDGDLRLQGSGKAPAADLSLHAGIHGHDQLSSLELDTTVWLLPPTSAARPAGSATVDLVRRNQIPPTAPRSGLAAQLRVTHQDSLLLVGEASIPGQVSLMPFVFDLMHGEPGNLEIQSRTIQLAELAPYLPTGLTLSGACVFSAAAHGTQDDLRLEGEFKAPGIQIRTSDNSWVAADGQVRLGGTLQTPQVNGEIQVTSGLIRLPEVPPNLLPTEGEALLWQAVSPDSATRLKATRDISQDSVLAGVSGATPASMTAAPHTPITPDLSVTLQIPGNLRLQGHGLRLELVGNMKVGLQGNLPVAVGTLEAFQGSLRFLGRVFTIERGKLTFYGDEVSLNPTLDLRLTATVDGVVIWIQLLGTVEEPELVLSSDPFLSDGDIISTLLFGKPLYDLDSGQQNLVTSRAGEVLAMYGSVKLQDTLSRQLGVDVISYSQATDSRDKSSLTIGKYLSPKVLMKYEKVLDQSSAYYVHLSYFLNRNFKLQTTYSEGGNSGITLGWNKEY